MGQTDDNFDRDGAQFFEGALTVDELKLLEAMADSASCRVPGTRLHNNRFLDKLLAENGSLDNLAKTRLGPHARPVRAILFDKTAITNWRVPWHQDRTIAVREKCDVPGFGPWSRKAGLLHVEPPFALISRMITLRAHLDDCDEANAPLAYATGSHRLGRIPANEIDAAVEKLGSKLCLADAGDVWLYATAIVHSSEPARMPKHRRVLQVDYSTDQLPEGLDWLGV